MSSFGEGHIGGRGTWLSGHHQEQQQDSSNFATFSSTKSKQLTLSASSQTWQNRMATIKEGDFGSLTIASSATSASGFKYRPRSPSSSPPSTPVSPNSVSVQWHTTPKTQSPKEKDHQHYYHDHGITKCICNRNFTQIMCMNCSHELNGRVRTPCPRHPNTIHLMDIDRCPVCKATNLSEMMPGVIHTRPH